MSVVSLREKADAMLRAEAIDNLTQRLQAGQTVGRFDFTSILDCELNDDHRYLILLSEISALLQTDGVDKRDYLADQIRDGIIERFLNSPNQELLIAEEMAEIEASPPSDADYEDAVAMGIA